MFSVIKKNTFRLLVLGLVCLSVQACNKEFEEIAPETPIPSNPSGATLNELINTDTSFSILKAAIAKAGLGSTLGNAGLRFTFFAPDNNAFRRSGIPSADVINSNLFFDTATVRSILRYHIIPQTVTAEQIPTAFPNFQYPTLLNPAPQLSALLRLTSFPSRRDNGAWLNNIPIIEPNIAASNGVIHKVLAIVAPPSKSVYEIANADTTLTFLMAALTRADSGRTTIADTSLIEISKSIGANLTLFAPTNQAFRQFLTAMGLPPSPAVFNALPVTTVRGLLAYHTLMARAFSVNMPATPTFIPTFLNSAVPNHPGINVAATFTGPFVTQLKVTGVGNGGNSSNVIAADIHATNGVIHKIDMVLLPQ
jgi:uncharacterized surface protein with fasciclin (FAS1) repeats